PIPVFLYVRCVDDEHVCFLIDAIYQQVIDDASFVVRETTVLNFTIHQFRCIVTRRSLNEIERTISFQYKFSHVRDIEYADFVSYVLVFDIYSLIRDWHEITGKGNHLRSERNVNV